MRFAFQGRFSRAAVPNADCEQPASEHLRITLGSENGRNPFIFDTCLQPPKRSSFYGYVVTGYKTYYELQKNVQKK